VDNEGGAFSPTQVDPLRGSINLTRRIDFALFMADALENDSPIQKAPAIVGCRTPSAIGHISKK